MSPAQPRAMLCSEWRWGSNQQVLSGHSLDNSGNSNTSLTWSIETWRRCNHCRIAKRSASSKSWSRGARFTLLTLQRDTRRTRGALQWATQQTWLECTTCWLKHWLQTDQDKRWVKTPSIKAQDQHTHTNHENDGSMNLPENILALFHSNDSNFEMECKYGNWKNMPNSAYEI